MRDGKITPEPPEERPHPWGPLDPAASPRSGPSRVSDGQGGWYRGALLASSLRRNARPRIRRRRSEYVQPRPRPGRPARPRARHPELLARPEDLPAQPGAVRGPSRVGLLRGPADRQRHAGRAPHRGPRLQGRLPALPDHEGLPRGPQGRLGLPRPAGGAGRREGAGLLRQAGHRAVRHRRVQRQVPRVGHPAHRRVHQAHRADGLLGRPRRGLPDDGPSYVQSVWWSLKQIFDKGRLVQDHRVAPWCPRCGTGLSDHELAQGYETVVDPRSSSASR